MGYFPQFFCFFFSFPPGPSLVQGWLGWGSLCTQSTVGPPTHSWTSAGPSYLQLHTQPSHSSGVTWADEIMYVKAFVNGEAPVNAKDYCCYYSYHTPGKPCCPPSPHPPRPTPQDSRGHSAELDGPSHAGGGPDAKPPPAGGALLPPSDPPLPPAPPPLGNGFPSSSWLQGPFLRKEISSVPVKVLELLKSSSPRASPHAHSPSPLPSKCPPWSQAAPEGSDRQFPRIVCLGLLGPSAARPTFPTSSLRLPSPKPPSLWTAQPPPRSNLLGPTVVLSISTFFWDCHYPWEEPWGGGWASTWPPGPIRKLGALGLPRQPSFCEAFPELFIPSPGG